MSKDTEKTPNQIAQALVAERFPAPPNAKAIPVMELRFRAGQAVDVIGKQGASAIRTGTVQGRTTDHYEILFLPWIRHHAIVFTATRGDEVTRKLQIVHETWCVAEFAS